MGRATYARRRDLGNPVPVLRHPELLPFFCIAIAIELVHLRWIMLTQWRCRGCKATHLECACKYGWLKRYL
jgi:hypothetical protein